MVFNVGHGNTFVTPILQRGEISKLKERVGSNLGKRYWNAMAAGVLPGRFVLTVETFSI